ncbi:hypothetical protein DPMN_141896 [Dreissena polymorpha]|uniref:Carboxylesterase type B domain-containing protein n=1 Tax=Dreissena polymorpha TaxID=45954 RepID=A0A9D4JKC1_DREPO|nr:hypothetical protein DPMN_141896 [Dreissena polymorpha]
MRITALLHAIALLFALGCVHRQGTLAERGVKKRLSDRIVRTQYGQMRGILIEFTGANLRPVDAYIGIQYATTFAAQMRFMPPTSSAEKWREMRVMIGPKPACPQPVFNETYMRMMLARGEIERRKGIAPSTITPDEDCHYVNVYVPTGRDVLCCIDVYLFQ